MLLQEFKTAKTLLDLHGSPDTSTAPKAQSTSTATSPTEIPDEADATEKIVGGYDIPHTGTLNRNDAMELIMNAPLQQADAVSDTLNVETLITVNLPKSNDVPAAADQLPALNVETPQLKECHICVRPLENILFDDIDRDQPKPVNDLPIGEHFNCSRLNKPVARTSHIPHKASAGKQYEEEIYSGPESKKRKSKKPKPSASGPSETRVTAQRTKSLHPTRRFPPVPVPSNGDGDDSMDTTDEHPPPYPKQPTVHSNESTPTNKKGMFITKSHTL